MGIMMKSTLGPTISFGGSHDLKATILAYVKAHRLADTLCQGEYYNAETGRCCHVGCVIMSVSPEYVGVGHDKFASIVGCHPRLSYLQEYFFENLPLEKAQAWSEAVIAAMPVGTDMDRAYWSFMRWLLIDPHHGVINHAGVAGRGQISRVADLCRRAAEGDMPGELEWSSAERAAAVAGWTDASGAAATSVAASVVSEVAGAVAASAAKAASVVSEVAVAASAAKAASAVSAAKAASAERGSHIKRMAARLIKELRGAK